MGVFSPIHKKNLSRKQISNTLRAISVIKEKYNGILKGRTYADGRKQCNWFFKYKTALSIVHSDLFIMVTAIEAMEHRDVATANIKGVYLHTHQKDFSIVKFIDEQVNIIYEIESDYKKFVTHEGSKKVLYLMLLKALYSTLTASLLWYNFLVSKLL